MPVRGCLGSNVIDLCLDTFDSIAVGEIPVRHPRRHITCSPRAAALKDLRVRTLDRLGFEGVIVEAIEITLEGEVVGSPDPLERSNELL